MQGLSARVAGMMRPWGPEERISCLLRLGNANSKTGPVPGRQLLSPVRRVRVGQARPCKSRG